jgi:Ca2+-binding RTX toxin-like protein
MTFAIWGVEDIVRVRASGTSELGDDVVAALPNGGYLALFREGDVLYVQRYDGAGAKVGSLTAVGTAAGMRQADTDLLVNQNGSFAVSWVERVGSTTQYNVKSRVYDANGAPVGANPVTITTVTTSSAPTAPSVAAKQGGGYISVYEDGGIKLAVHNPDGTVVGTPLTIAGSSRFPDITQISDTKYIVTYRTQSPLNVTFKVVDLSQSPPVQDTATTVGGGRISDVVALKNADGTPNGRFAIVYGSEDFKTVTIKTYDSETDTDVASATLTTTRTGSSLGDILNVTALKDGRIAVVYSAKVGDDNSDIFLKIVEQDGVSVSEPLLVGSLVDTGQGQYEPSVTQLADGRVAVIWHDLAGSTRIATNIVDARIAAVIVNGTAGNDVYAGSEHAGNQLNGLGGNDKLIGGAGSDIMDGGDGIDTASYERSTAGVIVSLAGGPGAGGDAAGDTYANIENVIGSQHGDTITGNDAANYLWGLGGNDALIGGGGQDTLEGGAGNDSYYVDASDVIVEAAGGGIDTVYTNGSINLAAMANIENIVFTGAGPVNITGTADDNTLNGGAGGDGIDGGAGNDVLNGGDGNDSLYGGAGNDVLLGGNGFDYLTGDIGNDTLDGGDNDFLDGGAGFDSLVGGAGNDTLNGGADNDVLDGGAGFDNLIGGDGFDAVWGGDGNDTLIGGNGNDTLDGGVGDDRIWGGLGKDVLTGGAGKDIFVFDYKPSKSHADRITDFNYRQDTIYIENSYFKKFGSGSITKPGKLKSQFFKVGTKATDANDYIVYNKKTGVLYWDKDGSGGAKAVEIAYLKKGATLTVSDFLII